MEGMEFVINTASRHAGTTYQVSCAPVTDLDALAPVWRDLETRADATFFNSWLWISAWLAGVETHLAPCVLTVRRGDAVVGLAVACHRQHRRFGFLPVRAWHLSETGQPEFDAITVEYNDVLAERSDAQAITQALLTASFDLHGGVDEVRASGSLRQLPDGALPHTLVRTTVQPAYQVNLAAISAAGTDYLGFLKQRPRYLVRKSLKRLGSPQPLQVKAAGDLAQGRAYLAELKRLHNLYWHARGEVGAFALPFQDQLHDRLLSQGLGDGSVVLLQVAQGDTVLGYFYYFCHRGWVHYYQSGVDYEKFSASDSPGLAAHALAIEHFRAAGHQIYDFMIGDYQYKRTLSTEELPMYWTVYQRDTAKMRLERSIRQTARDLRDRYQQWRERRAQPAATPPAPANEAPSAAGQATTPSP